MSHLMEELYALAKRLQALLEDPHPGLSTWCEAYEEVLEKIAEFSPRRDT